VLDAVGVGQVDAVLLDVGMSSDQLADRDRGFSFDSEGLLDLRFDPTEGEPAWRLVNRLRVETLADLIYELGEERFSRRIARRIVDARETSPIRSAREFARIVSSAVPRQNPPSRIHPATRTFQALRIGALKSGGRLVVVTFHSLEDRIVKRFLQETAGRTPCRLGPSAAAGARCRSEFPDC